MLQRRLFLALPALGMAPLAQAQAAEKMDEALRRRVVRAIAGGLHYLRGQQGPDGSVMRSVGSVAYSTASYRSPSTCSSTDCPTERSPIASSPNSKARSACCNCSVTCRWKNP